jgi:sulfofructose kinase
VVSSSPALAWRVHCVNAALCFLAMLSLLRQSWVPSVGNGGNGSWACWHVAAHLSVDGRHPLARIFMAAAAVGALPAIIAAWRAWRVRWSSPSAVVHILCLGHATVDTILRVPAVVLPPAKVLATACVQTAGGMATNAATAAARLGARTTLLSRIGDDTAGALYLAHLRSESNLSIERVATIPGAHTSVSCILVDAAGERLVVPFQDDALGRVEPAPLVAAAIKSAGHPCAVNGCLVDVRWPEGAEALLSQLAERDCRVRVFDADVAPIAVLQRLASLSTHVVFSEPGLQIFACGLPRDEGRDLLIDGIDVEIQALLLRARHALPNADIVGVTLGAAGVIWLEDCGGVQHVQAPEVATIDTLGAGDVFHGALAVTLAEGMAIRQASEFACAAAALKCTRLGGRLGAPTRLEVNSFAHSVSVT